MGDSPSGVDVARARRTVCALCVRPDTVKSGVVSGSPSGCCYLNVYKSSVL